MYEKKIRNRGREIKRKIKNAFKKPNRLGDHYVIWSQLLVQWWENSINVRHMAERGLRNTLLKKLLCAKVNITF